MHQRLSDLLIPSYQVLLWLQISTVPKPPHFGSRLYPTSGCWQGWKGADKTQKRGIRGPVRDDHVLGWPLSLFMESWRHPLICISVTQLQPLDFVFLFSDGSVGEPVHRLSLRECFPVTCFGFVFLGFICHWLEHPPSVCLYPQASLFVYCAFWSVALWDVTRRVAFRFRNALAQLTDLTD